MNDDENIVAFLRDELDKAQMDDFLQEELRRLTADQAIRDNTFTVMTVGKRYRGYRLDTIPHEYLVHVLNHFDNLKPELRRAILTVLGCDER